MTASRPKQYFAAVQRPSYTYYGRAMLWLSILPVLAGLFLTTGERTYWELRIFWWGIALLCVIAGLVLTRLGHGDGSDP
jgi:Na+-driven multidrug efflux pump